MTPRMCGHDGARGTCHPLLGGKSVRRWRSATGKAVVQCSARTIHAFPATTAKTRRGWHTVSVWLTPGWGSINGPL